jgi:SAM-dependent methyltransferase
MNTDRSWQIGNRADGRLNRFYDRLRRNVNRKLVEFLSSNLRDGSDGNVRAEHRPRILEAGSGTAFATSVFRHRFRGVAAVCMDIDLDALREARRRDPQLPCVVGDLHRMPFRNGSFQLVFNSSTIEHLSRPGKALAEMQRVCHSGGRVFVGVPYRFGPLGFQPFIQSTRIGAWLGPVFSRRSLDALLRHAGLRPLHHIRYFFRFFIGALAVPAANGKHQE